MIHGSIKPRLLRFQDSGGIQDQLVERLTATLQQSLTVGPQVLPQHPFTKPITGYKAQ